MSTIKLKRSGTTGSVPDAADLVQGELAINYADNKLYALSHDNVSVIDLLEIGERVGVATFNGLSGDVFGVGSFNGLTGAIQGVSAWNGLTGNVDITNSLVQVFQMSERTPSTQRSLAYSRQSLMPTLVLYQTVSSFFPLLTMSKSSVIK